MVPTKFLSQMPSDLWQRLREQTREALTLSDPSDCHYFKFVYPGTVVAPSAVLTEYHLRVDWKEPVQSLKQCLREVLGVPQNAPVKITFAGRTLGEGESLEELGAVYGDKIYFNINDQSASAQIPQVISTWSAYFRDVVAALRRDRGFYLEIVDAVRQQSSPEDDSGSWPDDAWKLILLMRNLPGIYAEIIDAPTMLRVVQRLVDILQTSVVGSDMALPYHLANTLEWLAYLKPRMFESYDLWTGDQTRRVLAGELLAVVDPARNIPPRVRMEAAWALGWAGVASEDFGRPAYATLDEYAKKESVLGMAIALHGAALRCSMYHPTPYAAAALSQLAGRFQGGLDSGFDARRIAITERQDELLPDFRARMAERLVSLAPSR